MVDCDGNGEGNVYANPGGHRVSSDRKKHCQVILLFPLDMGPFTWRKTKRFGELQGDDQPRQISKLFPESFDFLLVHIGLLDTHLPSE